MTAAGSLAQSVSAPPNRIVPDLLHHSAAFRLSYKETDEALVFAFAGSTSSGLFSTALSQMSLGSSTWDPSAFAQDLFLDTFVKTCLGAKINGSPRALISAHLTRLLSHPPDELATIHFRRAIMAELTEQPDSRSGIERLYDSLTQFRTILEGTGIVDEWDLQRRQLDVLTYFRDSIRIMAEGFSGTESGLARLGAFGQALKDSDAFQAVEEILNYDEGFATMDVRIKLGPDGRIRGLQVLQITEDQKNQFVNPPKQRWLAKLELFARGYKFSQGEVMARLIDAVFEGVRAEFVALVQLYGDLEFYLGALGFWDSAKAKGLTMCFPELVEAHGPRVLEGLFNPLLLGAGIRPIPCDIRLDRQNTTLLITGPNSGGKTRLLQSVALTQLLAQSGLCIPAAQGSVALTPGLVVSLIQETRADQTEGRLGVELMRIRTLFERLPPGAMVILDELCSGTNPSEGEEIFELVIDMLGRLRPQALITTHFLEFAARLSREQRLTDLRFLQVVLGKDQEPTYQFAEGVARTSLASKAAARLGVTGEQLLALVEEKCQREERGVVR